jgi:NAD(P)-dependent dehydrogenase (short-subunit alcohol dehydrogenase family)
VFEDLGEKTALVTGASGGHGLHFAQILAKARAQVILAARNVDAVSQAAKDIEMAGGRAQAARLDVTDSASIDALFERFPAIDIVINNAGISGSAPAIEQTEAEFDGVIETNLKGVFLVAQGAARRMRERGRGGAIVNIASILGLRVAGNLAAYAASKAAVVQLTKSLALEWARHGIRVNAICPGYFETSINRDFFQTDAGKTLIKRIPARRLGIPTELDGPLLLLASDAGSYMTGSALVVDGGHVVSSL